MNSINFSPYFRCIRRFSTRAGRIRIECDSLYFAPRKRYCRLERTDMNSMRPLPGLAPGSSAKSANYEKSSALPWAPDRRFVAAAPYLVRGARTRNLVRGARLRTKKCPTLSSGAFFILKWYQVRLELDAHASKDLLYIAISDIIIFPVTIFNPQCGCC